MKTALATEEINAKTELSLEPNALLIQSGLPHSPI